MIDHDHSAARGTMTTCKLIVFKHASALGNAPTHKLFDLITVERVDKTVPARSFKDYTVTIDIANVPVGVEVIEMV